MNIVRIYNMRTWLANGIYSFEQFAPNSDLEISLSTNDETVTDSELIKSSDVPSLSTPENKVDPTKLTLME